MGLMFLTLWAKVHVCSTKPTDAPPTENCTEAFFRQERHLESNSVVYNAAVSAPRSFWKHKCKKLMKGCRPPKIRQTYQTHGNQCNSTSTPHQIDGVWRCDVTLLLRHAPKRAWASWMHGTGENDAKCSRKDPKIIENQHFLIFS